MTTKKCVLEISRKRSPNIVIRVTKEKKTPPSHVHFVTRLTVTLPRPSDELWIVTDAASSTLGLGATLYVKRGTSLLAAGFFSAKLRDNQARWLLCELEALAIAAAVRHWAQ